MPKNNKKWEFIDLFAGIGGFHIALHDLEAECVFASEWDEAARKTYRHNFNNKKNKKYYSPKVFNDNERFFNNDIREITKKKSNYKKDIIERIPKHNIICGGFPCQPFSNAGYKKGFKDPRGTLFYDILKIIKTHKPEAYFLENVSHFERHDNGDTFKIVKKYLKKAGYTFTPFRVIASDHGVPQMRKRLFMIGFNKKKATKKIYRHPINEEGVFKPDVMIKSLSEILGGRCTRDKNGEQERKIGYTLRCGGRGSGIGDRRNWDSYWVNGKEMTIDSSHGIHLMGFPEVFSFPSDVTEAQRMKQLGNAVAVPAVRDYAREIINILNNYYA